VKLRHPQRFGGQVDAQHLSPFARHRVGQNAAAATNVEHPFPLEWHQIINPSKTQRIDLMQGSKLTLGIPPAMGKV
jgi:hypothetical protein